MIMTSWKDERLIKTFFSVRDMGNYKLVDMPDYEFNLSADEAVKDDKPFYFILDSGGFAKMIFTPDSQVTGID